MAARLKFPPRLRNKGLNKNWILGATLCSLTLFGCSGGSTPNSGSPLCTVNGEKIDMDTYYRYMEIKPTVQIEQDRNGGNVARVSRTIGFQTMTDLIKQTLVTQLAKTDGVYPNQDEIDKEIAFRKGADPNFLKSMSAMGLSSDMIKHDLVVSMCEDRIITKGIKVSKEDVDSYITDNPKSFVTPATVDLLWILVNTPEQKDAAEKDIASGQKFDAVASKYSQAPDARARQYHYNIRVLDAMPAPLKSAVADLAEGKATDWIQVSQTQWARFYVDKKTPEKAQKIDATVKEMVERKLARDRGLAANDIDGRIQKSLVAAKIEITPKNLKDMWATEMDNYRSSLSNKSVPNGLGAAPDTAANNASKAAPAPDKK